MNRDTGQAADPVVIRLLTPSARRGVTEVRITPGVVDDQAVELYLYGQCEMLALAVHEMTGWPLWVAEQQRLSGAWSWAHVGVRAPDGRWLDIAGPRDSRQVDAWLSEWGRPTRLRLMRDLSEWHVLNGRPPGTAAGWWRSQIAGGTDVNESFARLVISAVDGGPGRPGPC